MLFVLTSRDRWVVPILIYRTFYDYIFKRICWEFCVRFHPKPLHHDSTEHEIHSSLTAYVAVIICTCVLLAAVAIGFVDVVRLVASE